MGDPFDIHVRDRYRVNGRREFRRPGNEKPFGNRWEYSPPDVDGDIIPVPVANRDVPGRRKGSIRIARNGFGSICRRCRTFFFTKLPKKVILRVPDIVDETGSVPLCPDNPPLFVSADAEVPPFPSVKEFED